MKQEVSNIFNYQQNFLNYLEGLRLLEYPTIYKKKKKKSTELREIEKMSSSALSVKKERHPVSSSDYSVIAIPDSSSVTKVILSPNKESP